MEVRFSDNENYNFNKLSLTDKGYYIIKQFMINNELKTIFITYIE